MDEHTSHELAYKKGYDKGYADAWGDGFTKGYEGGYEVGFNANKWIPVAERLPEKEVKVLTFGKYGFSVNYRDRFSGKWRGINGQPQWITHWCELPEPPKGE